jgi:hypothetical protein
MAVDDGDDKAAQDSMPHSVVCNRRCRTNNANNNFIESMLGMGKDLVNHESCKTREKFRSRDKWVWAPSQLIPFTGWLQVISTPLCVGAVTLGRISSEMR